MEPEILIKFLSNLVTSFHIVKFFDELSIFSTVFNILLKLSLVNTHLRTNHSLPFPIIIIIIVQQQHYVIGQ
jgi:hypothetical protein